MSNFFSPPYYLYHDFDHSNKESPVVHSADGALELNAKGFSVCFMPNRGKGRNNADVDKVHSWFVDIDFKDTVKPELDVVMELTPLIPTYVVETKNGYHIYFLCKYGSLENFKPIQKRLVHFFDGDPKCVNLARIMRAPGFKHMKNPESPFSVDVVFQTEARYAEGQMFANFPEVEEPEAEQIDRPSAPSIDSDNIFDRIRHHDSIDILQALSGTAAVGYKQYKFKRTSNNRFNIIVDGKDSGCFVNERGNVIGTDGYSGGAVEWLKWYGHSRVDAMSIIKGVMGW